MIRIARVTGAEARRRDPPVTSVNVDDVTGVVYQPGCATLPVILDEETGEPSGTFERGPYRLSGLLFTLSPTAGMALLELTDDRDLVVRYRAPDGNRRLTFLDVLFSGDMTVNLPDAVEGPPTPIAVPFRAQIAAGETLSDHLTDEPEP